MIHHVDGGVLRDDDTCRPALRALVFRDEDARPGQTEKRASPWPLDAMVQLGENRRHWMDLRPRRLPFASYFSLVFLRVFAHNRTGPFHPKKVSSVRRWLVSMCPDAVNSSCSARAKTARYGV